MSGIGAQPNQPQQQNMRQAALTSNSLTETGVEFQGLTIIESHNINVAQTEVQGLFLLQAALQAAVEAAIVILGRNEENNLQQLQTLAQALSVTKIETQSMLIKHSDGVTVTQTEVQVEAVVQAAINLLAQLLVKVA